MAEIGIVSRRFPPAEGGVERFLGGLLCVLKERHAFRAAAQIFSDAPERPGGDDLCARAFPDLDYHGIPVKSLSPDRIDRLRLLPCGLKLLPGLRRFAYAPLKRMAVRRFADVYFHRTCAFFRGVSLIHSFAFDGAGLLACRVTRELHVPFVITPFMHPRRWGDNPENIALYNAADAIVALHEADRQQLLNAGVCDSRIRVIGVGIGPASGDGAAFRARHNIRGPLLLFVGRLVRHKGYAELVCAVEELVEAGMPLTLLMMGPHAKNPVSFFNRRLSSNIRYLGHANEQEKQDALAACDLFCLPSDSEILPVTILEAWSAGKPVLVGDIPALRCLVQSGKTGVFVHRNVDTIKAALREFTKAPDAWKRMGDNGRALVEREYTMTRIAEKTDALYRELLEQRGCG
ncbi:MAG: glycosyltransferase family 4 protein [Fibrobacterota bacterium]